MRFAGAYGDLLAIEAERLTVYAASGRPRLTLEVPGLLDAIVVGDELWLATRDRLIRRALLDGVPRASDPLEGLELDGGFLQSSLAPHLPVWHQARPVVIRTGPVRTETPGPGGEVLLPVSESRWLVWHAGQLRLWRALGDAWRVPLGDRGARVSQAQLVLDGRLIVLVQPRDGEAPEVRLSVAAFADGAPHTQLRVPGAAEVQIAARRAVAVARVDDRISLLDLRFGRWLRDRALPAGVTEIAVDDELQRIALGHAGGVEIVAPSALGEPGPATPHRPAAPAAPVAEPVAPPPPVAPAGEDRAPLPDAPLRRLLPATVRPTATPAEVAQSAELWLQRLAAHVGVAIAEAWDHGRIVKPDPARPPFADEVAGLLRLARGRAWQDLDHARDRLLAADDAARAAAVARAGRLTPLEVLAHELQLSPLAQLVLVALAAPRLRGELARLYVILANDPARGRPDEYLLGQLLGADQRPQIARELDGDRALRRYGLVSVEPGDRPFARLIVEPRVVRVLAGRPATGEHDPHLVVRDADRALEELWLPHATLARAMRALASPHDDAPVRLVVRGRTGAGRHAVLAGLAARAGRALGVIDLGAMPRDPGHLARALGATLRRALLRGAVPCVDGLERTASEDPDTQRQLATVLRDHPGPLAIRLPADARVPLDPGYLVLDLPQRNEQQRDDAWQRALARQRIDLPDASQLAARYRVGPGIIERVCTDVARRPDPPRDPAGWLRVLDDAVRQHLENRLGATATRVTRLARWADIVLPDDIVDSLRELTARVRHRKQVYEAWGFDRTMTSSRGITALFQGPPGTGKTMVAGAIARDLGLELYRVDVSRITSKWIGETEKNLGALFDAAEDGQVLLLFDEADSLFGKRTEVKTSVDRYANMEVNYLLQRLDSFEGIAILTTNFGSAIDPAFKRRLTYRMTFPFPDEDMRQQLWRSLIPPEVPIEGALDLAGLARRFRLSGGYIRNAALRAAFLAAEEGSALTHGHLARAIRMEFRELGKLGDSGALE